jgi:hypothetical protein
MFIYTMGRYVTNELNLEAQNAIISNLEQNIIGNDIELESIETVKLRMEALISKVKETNLPSKVKIQLIERYRKIPEIIERLQKIKAANSFKEIIELRRNVRLKEKSKSPLMRNLYHLIHNTCQQKSETLESNVRAIVLDPKIQRQIISNFKIELYSPELLPYLRGVKDINERVADLICQVQKTDLPSSIKRQLVLQYYKIPVILENLYKISESNSILEIIELRLQTWQMVQGESPPMKELFEMLNFILLRKTSQNLDQ